MPALPQDPHLDQLRRRARELHRAVRTGDAAALARVARHHPEPVPEPFRLTAAQLVVAREHGFPSWPKLRHYLELVTERSWRPSPPPADEPPADRFLRLVCPTGDGDTSHDRAAAADLLATHPRLPGDSLAVAAVCADPAAVRQHLERGADANARGGPHDWSPLLYAAHARFGDADASATREVVRLLLDAGADPNDGRFWHGLPTPNTVLTGVFGGGEASLPPHPHALTFARLLLDAGADPNDGQTIYNRMFDRDDSHLELLFEHGLGRDIGGPWYRRFGEHLESPAVILRSLLAWAIAHDQRDRVALLAAHGVDITSPFTELRSPRRGTPVEFALVCGHRELAAQLRDLGAPEPRLEPEQTFVAAVLAGDADEVARTDPETIARVRASRPGLVVWAAAQGAPNAIDLLVGAGWDVDARGRSDIPAEQPWQTALHTAVERDDEAQARRLLELGADPNVLDKRYGATPLGWARHFDRPGLVALLEPLTAEV